MYVPQHIIDTFMPEWRVEVSTAHGAYRTVLVTRSESHARLHYGMWTAHSGGKKRLTRGGTVVLRTTSTRTTERVYVRKAA